MIFMIFYDFYDFYEFLLWQSQLRGFVSEEGHHWSQWIWCSRCRNKKQKICNCFCFCAAKYTIWTQTDAKNNPNNPTKTKNPYIKLKPLEKALWISGN